MSIFPTSSASQLSCPWGENSPRKQSEPLLPRWGSFAFARSSQRWAALKRNNRHFDDDNEEEGDNNEEDEENITLVAIPADTSAAYKSLGENPAPQEAGSWFSSFPALEHASDIFHDDADDGDDHGGIGDLRIPI